ncbi:MAG: hypothetical protein ACW986_02210 [Promethearchaeota archaeon]|jgi:hypothetical protein
MTCKLDVKNTVGPKALFDPEFIPPKLLYRKKEQNSLNSILTDSIIDKFSLNILYQGINGIGKKAMANKVINDLINKRGEVNRIFKVCIDCKEKNFEELVFSLLSDLTSLSNLNVNYESFLNSNLSHLWNVFKLICKKSVPNLIFVFSNVEYLKPEILKKFLLLGKENNITSLFTINKMLRPTTIDLLSEFDLKKKLSYYSYNELYSILKQRVSLAFSHEVENDLVHYITDLIFEQYVPVPGKGIEILRDLYPLIRERYRIKNFELIELCQNHFDHILQNDEFTMLNYISEENILNVLFLDNLSNYFNAKMSYYITLNELKELYYISCELLEYPKCCNEFKSIFEEMLNLGILRPSKKKFQEKTCRTANNPRKYNSYFMMISPNQLKTLIDTIFEKNSVI